MLEYQSPEAELSKERRLAVRTLRGTGWMWVVVGAVLAMLWMLMAFATFGSPRFGHGCGDIIAVAFMGLYALSFLVCGILYLIGGAKVRRRDRKWEGVVIIEAWVQVLLVGMAAVMFMGMTMEEIVVVALGIHVVVLFRLGILLVDVWAARGS
jgi:hypothetical protein